MECIGAAGVSDARRRVGVAPGAGAAAPGRRDRAAGVRAGAGGHRSQPSDAVSRLVPQQARIHGHFCRLFG